MRAFIIRPFGSKAGIDFDRVESALIGPALTQLGIEGRTTGEVLEAGNIREDMFQMLLVADLVVADISIDNPNAYYELGIRHALREKRTFLLRARGQMADVPFDLRTDRYLAYDPGDPGAVLPSLVDGLRATIESERQDSPVFRLLPELREQERSRFLPIPLEFREEVERAAKAKLPGKLALLGTEAQGALWESEGLRLVAREQFRARAFEGAKATLESLRALDPLDKEANILLGTVYQRLGNPAESELALRRVVDHPAATPVERAEAFALIGRNLKTRWAETWRSSPVEARRALALRSALLLQAYDAYVKAFRQDLNHFYSGVNALAMLTILLELVAELPEAWESRFGTSAEAEEHKSQYAAQRQRLAGAVEFSILANKQCLEQVGKSEPWVDVSLADLRFLTSSSAGQVAYAYETALAGQPEFIGDSVRAQIALYHELGLFTGHVERVLGLLPAPSSTSSRAERTILFTGHQMDAPDRTTPRFPPDKEQTARDAIRDALRAELAHAGAPITGMAGGASGGDLLFHEVCAELGIPTRLFLTLPVSAYVAESVAPAAGDWIPRFYAVYDRFTSVPVLQPTTELPGWLPRRENYSVWQRNNLWVLDEALAGGAAQATVIALWNGQAGDGPGGTADMIAIARRRGARVCVLDSNRLFGLPAPDPGA